MFVPFLGYANAYETKHHREDYAARMAAKHSSWDEVMDGDATVRYLKDIQLHGDDSPYFLARLAYLAGIAAGVHRERQRRKSRPDCLQSECEGRV